MVLNTIEESEVPEYFMVGTVAYARKPADSVGQVILVRAGHHPKVRITKCYYDVLAYATAADVIALEEEGGTDHATLTGGAAIGVNVDATITDDIFEKNEAICYNLTTDGNAANAGIFFVQFESIH